MTDESAHAILEPAATRVRDPLSGRSIWLAGMVKDARLSDDEDQLVFTLQTTRQHSADDRAKIKATLLRNIERVGWKGEVICHMAVGGGSAPAPGPAPSGHSHSHDHGGTPAPKKKDAVRGCPGPGWAPTAGPSRRACRGSSTSSPSPGQGRREDTVAVNLAAALASRGLRVA